jgi:hypothetical protein
MSSIRFLCDEDVPAQLIAAMRQAEPIMDVLVVGEIAAPPRRTPDPELLLAAESMTRLLLSMDKSTKPRHLRDHFEKGHHTHGVILVRQGFTLAACLEAIMLIWGATTAEEWFDWTAFIP